LEKSAPSELCFELFLTLSQRPAVGRDLGDEAAGLSRLLRRDSAMAVEIDGSIGHGLRLSRYKGYLHMAWSVHATTGKRGGVQRPINRLAIRRVPDWAPSRRGIHLATEQPQAHTAEHGSKHHGPRARISDREVRQLQIDR
jgi:hypothetical protein